MSPTIRNYLLDEQWREIRDHVWKLAGDESMSDERAKIVMADLAEMDRAIADGPEVVWNDNDRVDGVIETFDRWVPQEMIDNEVPGGLEGLARHRGLI